jgi:glucosyl-dolichyl phosphate glucuronosyltransferase
MKLSIVICTFNRATPLEQLLEDLSYQLARMNEEDSREIEIILIDNNSYDSTKEIAYKYSESTILSCKYFLEHRFGLAFCRNLAIRKAQGKMIAFLHDDLTLDEDWLKEAYKISCHCEEREIGVYGGRSIPLWQDRTEPWLYTVPPYGIDQAVFGGHSFGDAELYYPLSSTEGSTQVPSGINVLIRKDIFDNCGDFRTDLGPNAAGEGFDLHDDYEFFEYLQTINVPMVYVPQLIVFHPVEPKKMKIKFVRRWYYKSGRSLYWIAHTDRVKRKVEAFLGVAPKYKKFFPKFTMKLKLFSKPLYLWLKLFYLFVAWAFFLIIFDQKKSNWFSFMISKALGELDAVDSVKRAKLSKKFSFRDRIKFKKPDFD